MIQKSDIVHSLQRFSWKIHDRNWKVKGKCILNMSDHWGFHFLEWTKEGNALSTQHILIWLYGIGNLVKDHSDSYMGYSFRLAARGLLYAPSHRQDNRYHGLIHIWPIHTSWAKTLHLSVSTVSVFWQCNTFWRNAIILLKKERMYLVREMWGNHLDSTPHSFCYI